MIESGLASASCLNFSLTELCLGLGYNIRTFLFSDSLQCCINVNVGLSNYFNKITVKSLKVLILQKNMEFIL